MMRHILRGGFSEVAGVEAGSRVVSVIKHTSYGNVYVPLRVP